MITKSSLRPLSRYKPSFIYCGRQLPCEQSISLLDIVQSRIHATGSKIYGTWIQKGKNGEVSRTRVGNTIYENDGGGSGQNERKLQE